MYCSIFIYNNNYNNKFKQIAYIFNEERLEHQPEIQRHNAQASRSNQEKKQNVNLKTDLNTYISRIIFRQT